MASAVEPVQFPQQGYKEPAGDRKEVQQSDLHVRHPDRKEVLAGGTCRYAGVQDRVTAHHSDKGEKPQDRRKPLKVHDGNMQGHTQT